MQCFPKANLTLKKTLGDKERKSRTRIDRECDNMRHKSIVKL